MKKRCPANSLGLPPSKPAPTASKKVFHSASLPGPNSGLVVSVEVSVLSELCVDSVSPANRMGSCLSSAAGVSGVSVIPIFCRSSGVDFSSQFSGNIVFPALKEDPFFNVCPAN